MVATAIDSAVSFPLFSCLPLELRLQIWRDALPHIIRPAIHFFQKGCWDRQLSPPNNEFKYGLGLLDIFQFEMPVFFVNREARDVVWAWIRKHGIKTRAHEDRRSILVCPPSPIFVYPPPPIFVCPFDPIRDVLYVALDKWDEFSSVPYDLRKQMKFPEKHIATKTAFVTRIAVPEALFRRNVAADLVDMLVICPSSILSFSSKT